MRSDPATVPTVPAQPATPGQALRWAADRIDADYYDQEGGAIADIARLWADELDAAPQPATADHPGIEEAQRLLPAGLAGQVAALVAEVRRLRAERDMLAKALVHPRRLVDARQLPERGPLSSTPPAGTEGEHDG